MCSRGCNKNALLSASLQEPSRRQALCLCATVRLPKHTGASMPAAQKEGIKESVASRGSSNTELLFPLMAVPVNTTRLADLSRQSPDSTEMLRQVRHHQDVENCYGPGLTAKHQSARGCVRCLRLVDGEYGKHSPEGRFLKRRKRQRHFFTTLVTSRQSPDRFPMTLAVSGAAPLCSPPSTAFQSCTAP